MRPPARRGPGGPALRDPGLRQPAGRRGPRRRRGLDAPRPPKRERERESFLERVTHRTLAAQLRLEDQEIYGFGWEPDEKRKVAVAAAAHFAYWLLLIFLDPSSFVHDRQVDYYWWGRFFAQSALLFGAWVLIGLLHHKLQLKVNYSRKICHIVLFIMPMFIMMIFGKYDTDTMSFAWLTFGSFFQFYMFVKPVRRFLPVPFLLMFRCIDRPEDRPYTIPWLVTQSIGGFGALIVLVVYLQWKSFSLSFLLIPMVVNGLGDGLAEPVGVRFGRHKYVTRALFYKGKFCFGQFQRSLEGSACVFVSALASVLMLKNQWASDLRFYFALGIFPIGMTATEAFSPHTWDTPFIFLMSIFFIMFLFECVPDNLDFNGTVYPEKY